MLFSCQKQEEAVATSQQVQMTEYSENLSVITSENGQKSYHFTAPLMEGYTLAREPYREFRKGVRIVTYTKGDSLSTVDATLTANYAIYYEKRELWEAKGNVVIIKEDGKRLYTQQLFWNATTKRIYSNVDTRIVDGVDNFIGEGFESDDALRKWKFRRMKGRMTVEMTPPGERDDELPLAPTPLEQEERAGRLAPLADSDRAGADGVGRAPAAIPATGVETADGYPAADSPAAGYSAPPEAHGAPRPATSGQAISSAGGQKRNPGEDSTAYRAAAQQRKAAPSASDGSTNDGSEAGDGQATNESVEPKAAVSGQASDTSVRPGAADGPKAAASDGQGAAEDESSAGLADERDAVADKDRPDNT